MKNADLPIEPVMMKQTGENEFRPAKQKELMADSYIYPTTGLTKREYFAGLAMQGLLSLHDGQMIVPNQDNVNYMALLAVKSADALLSELDKQN